MKAVAPTVGMKADITRDGNTTHLMGSIALSINGPVLVIADEASTTVCSRSRSAGSHSDAVHQPGCHIAGLGLAPNEVDFAVAFQIAQPRVARSLAAGSLRSRQVDRAAIARERAVIREQAAGSKRWLSKKP
jgi:hypothetical protein